MNTIKPLILALSMSLFACAGQPGLQGIRLAASDQGGAPKAERISPAREAPMVPAILGDSVATAGYEAAMRQMDSRAREAHFRSHR